MKQDTADPYSDKFKSITFLPTESDTTSIRVTVFAGSRYDPKGKEGVAHLLEHLLASGSKNFPNPRDLGNLVLARGGSYDIYTDREYLTFETKTTNENVEDGLRYLSEIIFNPLFTENNLERERQVIAEEIKSDSASPESKFWLKVLKEVWPDSWKSNYIMGSTDTIKVVTLADISDFYMKYYLKQNMTLVVAGKLVPKQTSLLIDQYFKVQ